MSLEDVREAVARLDRVLIVAGAILLVVAAWSAAGAYAEPVRETHVARVPGWTETSAFAYAVPVTRNSTHWEHGTLLPMGEPAYFRTISDAILVNYTWTPASDDPAARGIAAGHLTAHVVAAAPDGREYWAIERALDEATVANASEGLFLAGRVDLDDLVSEVSRLQAEIPADDLMVNWSVRATVMYAFDAHGSRDQGERLDVLRIEARDPRFVLPVADALAAREDHGRETTTVTTGVAGIPGVLSSWLLLAIAAAGIALLVAGIFLGKPTAEEAFDREMRRFRDWVSTAGRIPDHSADPYTTIDVRSLEDLVHVAADARTRVVLDERSRVFYAFLPGATYRYARHAY